MLTPAQQVGIGLNSLGVRDVVWHEYAGHGADREGGLVHAHELEDPAWFVSVSCTNQATAFAKMARSWRSCRFSRRRRANSSFSGLLRPSLR